METEQQAQPPAAVYGRSLFLHSASRVPPRNSQGKFVCDHAKCAHKHEAFTRLCEWRKHMNKHDRPYQCIQRGCEQLLGFTYSGGLLQHNREVDNKSVLPVVQKFSTMNRVQQDSEPKAFRSMGSVIAITPTSQPVPVEAQSEDWNSTVLAQDCPSTESKTRGYKNLTSSASLDTIYKNILRGDFARYPDFHLGHLQGHCRRGRGQRKNNSYWKQRKNDLDLNPYKGECLFSDKDGGLNVSSSSYMDSTCGVPRYMSIETLEALGLKEHFSTDFDDPGPVHIQGQMIRMQGIVRDLPFRIKGSSETFRGDFFVPEALSTSSVHGIIFGWQFMCNEAASILEKARRMYEDAKSFISDVASAISSKIEHVAHEAQNVVSGLMKGSSSTPPPPYSLLDVFDRDFVVRPVWS